MSKNRSSKAETNSKWVSSQSYRENYDRIFGKTKEKDFRHRPSFENEEKILYTYRDSVKYHHGPNVKYQVLPNGFFEVLKKDLK